MAAVVDRYGFMLAGLSDEEVRARRAAAARETTMANRWTKADVQSFDPSTHDPPKALKALVRGGIPAALRPDLWLRFSGGLSRKAAAPPAYYASLQRRAVLAPSGVLDAAELAAELSRAFGAHAFLSSAKGLRSVLHMLEAYHAHAAPKGGLGQGMGCVAAFLLVVMGPAREEDAFWALLALTHDRVPPTCVAENTRGHSVEQRMLGALLAKRFPKLAAQLRQAEVPLGDISAAWFHSLFAAALPAECAARVWDVLLLEGPKVLFRVALALFKMNESALLGSKHSMAVARSIKWRVARCFDADALFKVAFSGIGSLPGALIKRARADFEGIVASELAEHRRRLEAVLSSPGKRAGGACAGAAGGSSDSEADSSSPQFLDTIHEDYEEAFAAEPFSAAGYLPFLRPPSLLAGSA